MGKRLRHLSTALVAIAFLLPSAAAAWYFSPVKVKFAGRATADRAVAVLASDPNTYYTKVEKALEVANGKEGSETVYVLPGISSDENPIYIDTCTVGPGVTLSLPYKEVDGVFTTGFESSAPEDLYTENVKKSFADSTHGTDSNGSPVGVSLYKKTELVLRSRATLTIEPGGSLLVGGILANGSAGSNIVIGATSEDYAQISLEKDSQIICNGTMKVRGYVKPWNEEENDSCSLLLGPGASGAILEMPIVFYDFLGGTAALAGTGSTTNPNQWNGAALNGIFPIEVFDMPNVSVPFRAYYGSQVNCWYAMYMTGGGQVARCAGTIGLVGNNNSIITLTSPNSILTVDYEPAAFYSFHSGKDDLTRGLTIHDAYKMRSNRSLGLGGDSSNRYSDSWMARTKVVLDGDARTNDISITFRFPVIGDITVTTAGGTITVMVIFSKDYERMPFPFSYKWDITVENGTLSVPNSLKFLPGSNLTLGKDAELNVSGSFTVVELSSDDTKGTTNYYPLRDGENRQLLSGELVNNGRIRVSGRGSFGSEIKTTVAGSEVVFDPDSARTASAKSNNWGSAGNYEVRDFASRALIGYDGAVPSLGEFPGDSSNFDSVLAEDGTGYYRIQPSQVLVNDNGLTGYAISINGTEAEFEPGTAFNVEANAEVAVSYSLSDTSIGGVLINGVTPDYQIADGMVRVVTTAKGLVEIEILKATQVRLGEKSVNVNVSGEGTRKQISLDWTLSDQYGTIRNSDNLILEPGNDSIALSGFPDTVNAGWRLTVSAVISGDAGNDTLGVSSINASSGGSYVFKEGDTSLTITLAYTIASSESGCFAEGTIVTMGDGSLLPIEEVSVGDELLSFSHERGIFEPQAVMGIGHGDREWRDVLNLRFDNGIVFRVVYGHAFLNADTRLYEEIRVEDYASFIGNSYLAVSGGADDYSLTPTVLEEAYITHEYVAFYNPATKYNLNHVASGMLALSDDIKGLYNYFELDDGYAYDEEKKAADIEKYGLLAYEEVAFVPNMTRELFDVFNARYLKVSMGKGLVTFEELVSYVERWGDEITV